MQKTSPIRSRKQAGFTLLELLISLALLLVLSGAILGNMAYLQKNYRGAEIRTSLNDQMRAVTDLMTQEIGQAGLSPDGLNLNVSGLDVANSTSTANITQSIAVGTQTVTVNTQLPFQQNQKVWVDTGSSAAELVTISGISSPGTTPATITATFANAHSTTPIPVYAKGIFPSGILPPGMGTGYSNPYSLRIFGDVNDNGTLVLVVFDCPTTSANTSNTEILNNLTTDPPPNGAQWGPLLRSEYIYSSANGGQMVPVTGATNVHLMEQVRVNTSASGTPANGCRFDYYQPPNGPPGSYAVVTSVDITLVARSERNDPVTNQPVTVSKTYMNIQPRNVTSAYNLYLYDGTTPGEFLSVPIVLQNYVQANDPTL